MDMEEWVSLHTFYCPTLRLKLTPEKCKSNRKKPTPLDKKRAAFQGIYIEDQPLQCKKCKIWKTCLDRVGFSKEDEEQRS